MIASARATQFTDFLHDCGELVEACDPLRPSGRLTRVTGLVMEATGLRLPVGSSCAVMLPHAPPAEAEVVGFSGDKLYLMPIADVHGVTPGSRVTTVPAEHPLPRLHAVPHPRRRAPDHARHVPVGDTLLGRVLDSAGRPLDQRGPLSGTRRASLHARPLNPLHRAPISEVLDTGVRAINGLLTVGRGQRMGLFAGSGVGKSVLLGMMARYTAADVIVVGLIGERGREVKEFIESILGDAGLARAVVVAAPADVSPLMRLQGAAYATTIAEYFRDQGRQVLLIMDSLTRYAMAQREVALAIGEPPVTKGYPPSVFARLPQLVERAGNSAKGGGSITAFYTVLTEGDDPQDPVADCARAVLDGHIVLSRALADQGHYPAIDIESSVSRALTSLVPPAQFETIRSFKSLYSSYQRNRDLITVGAYAAGSDPQLDQAIALYPRMQAYLRQNMSERHQHGASIEQLHALITH